MRFRRQGHRYNPRGPKEGGQPMAKKELAAGDVAPDFTAPVQGGKTITLSDFRGGPVVLYFYPKDNTSG
jgi:hypothetical protein